MQEQLLQDSRHA